MSKEGVQAVINKAVTDSKFREELFAHPDQALHGFDLTEDEIAGLKRIDAESMESLAGNLDERISKSFEIGWAVGTGGVFRRKPKGKRTPPWRAGGPKP